MPRFASAFSAIPAMNFSSVRYLFFGRSGGGAQAHVATGCRKPYRPLSCRYLAALFSLTRLKPCPGFDPGAAAERPATMPTIVNAKRLIPAVLIPAVLVPAVLGLGLAAVALQHPALAALP